MELFLYVSGIILFLFDLKLPFFNLSILLFVSLFFLLYFLLEQIFLVLIFFKNSLDSFLVLIFYEFYLVVLGVLKLLFELFQDNFLLFLNQSLIVNDLFAECAEINSFIIFHNRFSAFEVIFDSFSFFFNTLYFLNHHFRHKFQFIPELFILRTQLFSQSLVLLLRCFKEFTFVMVFKFQLLNPLIFLEDNFSSLFQGSLMFGFMHFP